MRLYTKQHPFSYGRSAPQMAMKSEAVARAWPHQGGNCGKSSKSAPREVCLLTTGSLRGCPSTTAPGPEQRSHRLINDRTIPRPGDGSAARACCLQPGLFGL